MRRPILRGNSRIRGWLDEAGIDFLDYAAQGICRILPHVAVSAWQEEEWQKPVAVWTSSKRTEIRVTLSIGKPEKGRSLTAVVTRRRLPSANGRASKILDEREHDICKRVVQRVSEVLRGDCANASAASIQSIRNAFDEDIVSAHLQEHHRLSVAMSSVFDQLHTLSEQSYENRALTFGCILDPSAKSAESEVRFPKDFLSQKKYQALSDGFRTAYHVSADGSVQGLVDLDRFEKTPLSEKHFYPDWTERVARASRGGRCGIALSRQGDLSVFDEGSLRFTYRYGRWQYWNHWHLVSLLRDRAAAQRVPRRILGRVVGAIYRAALDVSFRRSGALFLILHNRRSLRRVVRVGDATGDENRGPTDRQFDHFLQNHSISAIPRAVVVELASLDGAMVFDNHGRIRAHGAVLDPRRSGHLRGTEGSRTKAAIGASHYGLAVKISSDGGIAVYFQGRPFIEV